MFPPEVVERLKKRESIACTTFYYEIVVKQKNVMRSKRMNIPEPDVKDISQSYMLRMFDLPEGKIDRFSDEKAQQSSNGYGCYFCNWSWRVFYNFLNDWYKSHKKIPPEYIQDLRVNRLSEDQDEVHHHPDLRKKLQEELHTALEKLNTKKRKRRYLFLQAELAGKTKSEILKIEELKIKSSGAYDTLKSRAHESLLWEVVVQRHTLSNYLDFLKKYPSGDYAPKVQQKMKSLLDLDTLDEEQVIDELPEIQQRFLQDRFQKEALEIIVWSMVTHLNTRKVYRRFIKAFPEGIFVLEAAKKMQALLQSDLPPEEIIRAINSNQFELIFQQHGSA